MNTMNSSNDASFVIAEAGVNHEGSIENALELVASASRAGCNAIKFQTYKADSIASINSPSYWDTKKESSRNQHQLFSKYDKFTLNDYETIIECCKNLDIEFMSTCFDLEWLDVLNPYLIRHKLASADITNYQLLKAVGKTSKPVILSTGATTFEEIKNAIDLIESVGKSKISILHCVLNYPTKIENANLNRIISLKEEFPNYKIGYSDHTPPKDGNHVLMMAYAMGVSIFEKHFTLDKTLPGNDHYHAFDESDMTIFVEGLSMAKKALEFSEIDFIRIQNSAIKNARRGIYVKKDLNENHIISENDLILLRPAGEIYGMDFPNLIGKRIKRSLSANSPLNREDFE